VQHSTGPGEFLRAFSHYSPLLRVELATGFDELVQLAFGLQLDL
jgi:hypothetical protein